MKKKEKGERKRGSVFFFVSIWHTFVDNCILNKLIKLICYCLNLNSKQKNQKIYFLLANKLSFFTLNNLGASRLLTHSAHTDFDFNGNLWKVLSFLAPGQPASLAMQIKSKKRDNLKVTVCLHCWWSQLNLWSKFNLSSFKINNLLNRI